MSRIISRIKTNYLAKNEAFPYQAQAFMTIKDMDYCAIFHEQGLGKTKIAIDLLLYWLSQKDIDTVLIVTKKQLVKNWIDEFSFHTHIKPKTLSSNKNDNFYVLNSPVKVIITNFETLSTDMERIKLFLKCRNVGIIIDESTKLKNPESKLTQTFFELADLFKRKAIMTGTPVANRPFDIWAQIFFLDKGASLGDDFEEFKRSTNLSNDLSKDKRKRIDFEEAVASIFNKISHFSIRETKKSSGVILPQKIYQTISADFEPEQYKMYKQIINDLEIEMNKNEHRFLDDDSASLKRLLRLMQVTSNPRLLNSNYSNLSAKEILLERLIDKIIQANEKCIVWSNYIENIEYFCEKYNNLNPQKIHGEMSISDRNRSVDNFKNNESCKILFATPQAAKEGLTLTVANHVIFYDRGFNLDDYLQAQDRIHRISQKKTCYIYNLKIPESVDEWIDVLLEAKQYAAFLAQGDITLAEYSAVADYSYGDIIKEILSAEEENE